MKTRFLTGKRGVTNVEKVKARKTTVVLDWNWRYWCDQYETDQGARGKGRRKGRGGRQKERKQQLCEKQQSPNSTNSSTYFLLIKVGIISF